MCVEIVQYIRKGYQLRSNWYPFLCFIEKNFEAMLAEWEESEASYEYPKQYSSPARASCTRTGP